MKIMKRWIELSEKIHITPTGYSVKLTDEEKLEYRTILTIKNVLTSQTGDSTIHRDVLLDLLKRLGWDSKGFKKGKFHYGGDK